MMRDLRAAMILILVLVAVVGAWMAVVGIIMGIDRLFEIGG